MTNDKTLTFDMTEFEFRRIINDTVKNKEKRKHLYAQIRQKKIIFLR